MKIPRKVLRERGEAVREGEGRKEEERRRWDEPDESTVGRGREVSLDEDEGEGGRRGGRKTYPMAEEERRKRTKGGSAFAL